MSRERTLRKIEAAFAEAAARGDFAEAEGWLAVAQLAKVRMGTAISTNSSAPPRS